MNKRFSNKFISKSALALAMLTLVAACGDDATSEPVTPIASQLTTLTIALPFNTIELGEAVTVVAKGFDQFGQPMPIAPATFASSNAGVVVVSATTGRVFAIAPGTTDITATVGGKTAHFSLTITKPAVRINEIVSNGDVPGGYIELINPSDVDVDLGGFTLTMSDVQNFVVLPAGFIIPAHGYLTVNEINIPHGIGASDAVHLFSKFDTLLDQFDWRGNPQQNFSRCPELNGPFLVRSATRRAANDCGNSLVPAARILQ